MLLHECKCTRDDHHIYLDLPSALSQANFFLPYITQILDAVGLPPHSFDMQLSGTKLWFCNLVFQQFMHAFSIFIGK